MYSAATKIDSAAVIFNKTTIKPLFRRFEPRPFKNHELIHPTDMLKLRCRHE